MSSPTFLQFHLSSWSSFPSTFQPIAAKEIRVQLNTIRDKIGTEKETVKIATKVNNDILYHIRSASLGK